MSDLLLQTTTRYFTALSTLNATLLTTLLSPIYTHTIAPQSASLGPPASRSETISRFSTLKAIFSSLPMQILQTWPNETARQVTVHVRRTGKFHPHVKRDGDGAEEWAFESEYMFVVEMDESGGKVERVFEFVDAKGMERMVGLVGKAFERVGGGWWGEKEGEGVEA